MFTAQLKGKKVYFSTEDEYSYNWFYPRYSNNGLHERKITELLVENCKNAQIFLDIGSHIGFFTCIVGKVFPRIKVHSFEMEDQVFQLLQKNVKLNNLDNISLYKWAVSDFNGQAYYEKPPKPNEKTAVAHSGDKEVKSIAIDDFGVVPDVVKIDVEGTELDVLRGMQKLLPKIKAIFIEIHPELYKDNEAEKILELLKDFRVYEICDHRRRPDPDIIRASSADFIHNNMLYAFRY